METLQKPKAGEAVNVQIIVAPQFGPDESKGSNGQSTSQDVGASETGDDNDQTEFGHGRRRGIFNIPSLELPRLSPATINIQIPGKLPFNPLNIFNVQTLKNFVQSVTDKFMRNNNDQTYGTGFDDSVTIISEDPEKPVSKNYGSSAVKNPTSELPSPSNTNSQSNVKQDRSGIEISPPQRYRDSMDTSDIDQSTTDVHLTEESMIDQQVRTLNEVLTNEMNHDKEHKPTSPSPPRLSFLPDLSALGQLRPTSKRKKFHLETMKENTIVIWNVRF